MEFVATLLFVAIVALVSSVFSTSKKIFLSWVRRVVKSSIRIIFLLIKKIIVRLARAVWWILVKVLLGIPKGLLMGVWRVLLWLVSSRSKDAKASEGLAEANETNGSEDIYK